MIACEDGSIDRQLDLDRFPLQEPESPEEPGKASGEGGPEEAEPEFDEGMVDHIQMMTSLIEEREVSREEIIEMIQRVMRQHSFGGEKRIEYILRYLKEHPP